MSMSELQRFVTDAKSNQKLQQDLRGKSGVSALLAAGNANGYQISQNDVKEYVSSKGGQLTDEQLAGVTGGIDSVTIVYIPNKSIIIFL